MTANDTIRLKTLAGAPLDAWVALSQDESRIVAVGRSYQEVAEKSDEVGEPDAIILKTPENWAPVSV